MKLFRYRPLNDILFKELRYQELYFSTFPELNDPLDLSARIEFSPPDKESLNALTRLLFMTNLFKSELPDDNRDRDELMVNWVKDKTKVAEFEYLLYAELMKVKGRIGFVSEEAMTAAVSISTMGLGFTFDIIALSSELRRLTDVFLKSSHICSFSEKRDSFLMWSHYASRHSGICLEFDLDSSGTFSFMLRDRERIEEPNKKSVWSTKVEYAGFKETVRQVIYSDSLPLINFFEFSPIFLNEGDTDVIRLSKSWTHKYAADLENVFTMKLSPWSYEKEWRSIQINFGKREYPEDRILHYPQEKLTGVYFGIRTPEDTKHRICNMLKVSNPNLKYYYGILVDGRLDFIPWYDSQMVG